MLKRLGIVVLVVLMTGLFFGCKNEMVVDLKLSDLIEVEKTEEPVFVDTEVAFSVMSKKEYDKSKEYLKRMVEDYFPLGVENFRYEQDGMDSLVKFNTKIGIYDINNFYGDSLFALVCSNKNFVFYVDKDAFGELRKKIKSDFMYNFHVHDIDISIYIENDVKKDVKLKTFSNYIDDYPMLAKEEMTVSDTIKIELSDLSKDHLEEHGVTGLLENNIKEMY